MKMRLSEKAEYLVEKRDLKKFIIQNARKISCAFDVRDACSQVFAATEVLNLII